MHEWHVIAMFAPLAEARDSAMVLGINYDKNRSDVSPFILGSTATMGVSSATRPRDDKK